MFAIVKDGIIVMLLQAGQPFTLDGVQYPPQWIQQSTPAQRAEIGLVDVVYGPQENQQYYWVTAQPPVYNAQANVVNINFTSTPKDLAGLKTQCATTLRQQAYAVLLPTDWMVVKAVETQGAVPEAWSTWRQAVRQTADAAVQAVEAAADVPALEAAMAAINWPQQPE